MIKKEKLTLIQEEYQQNEEFRLIMQQSEKNFQTTLQIALYSNLQRVQTLRIIEKVGQDSEKDDIFVVYGMFMPLEKKQSQKAYFLMVNILDSLITQTPNHFTIIYLNVLCQSYQNFFNFKNVLKSLPYKYLKKLKKILVVHPTFIIKSLQLLGFGILNKIISYNLEYVENIQELELYSINIKQISKKFPKQIINHDRSIDQQEFERQNYNRKYTIAPFIIQVEKNTIIGIKLENYQMCQQGFPNIIKILLNYFQMKPQKVKFQGIFRKNGDIQQQKLLEKHMVEKDYNYLNSIDDPYIVCGLIKKIFNNMQQPLFDYEIYNQILTYKQNEMPSKQFINLLLKKLKPINYNTLKFTLSFLVEKIIIYQKQNKMSNYNMAVVFSPCFFRPKQYKLDDLTNSIKFTKILHQIFQNFHYFFWNKIQQKNEEIRSQNKNMRVLHQENLTNQNEEIIRNKKKQIKH